MQIGGRDPTGYYGHCGLVEDGLVIREEAGPEKPCIAREGVGLHPQGGGESLKHVITSR